MPPDPNFQLKKSNSLRYNKAREENFLKFHVFFYFIAPYEAGIVKSDLKIVIYKVYIFHQFLIPLLYRQSLRQN